MRKCTLRNMALGYPYDKKAEQYAMRLAVKAKKKQPQSVSGALALSLFAIDFLQKEEAFEGTMSLSFDYARKMESEDKVAIIEASFEDEERKSAERAKSAMRQSLPEPWQQAKIFYLASKHGDCAEDHKDYQGKLYYNRFWRRCVKSKKGRKAVEAFIQRKRIRSVQWVIGRPVWFITRPNCRHYFEEISAGEAMDIPANELLIDREMDAAEGRRDSSQTIRHSINEGWYTEQNVRNIIKKYKERLAYHQALYEKAKNERLKGYIDKDRRLIQKWSSYLRSKF